MKEEKEILGLMSDAIDRTATAAEDIHKAVVGFPLDLIEEVAFLRKPAKEVHRMQERFITALYKMIRDINRRAEKLANELIGEVESAVRKTDHGHKAHARA